MEYKFIKSDDVTRSDRVKFKYKGERYGLDIGNTDDFNLYTVVEIEGIDLEVYTLEQILMDKISSMMSEKIYRRVKDVYDIYWLAKTNNVDMGKLLSISNIERYSKIDYHRDYPFRMEKIELLSQAYKKFKVGEDSSVKPEFSDVLEIVNKFMDNFVIAKVIESEDLTNLTWYKDKGEWE